MNSRTNVSQLAGILLSVTFLATLGCGGKASDSTPSAAVPARADQMDDAHPAVLLKTSLGDITVELDPKNSPIAVENFLAYVNGGKYNGSIFHKVTAGYMALGGGYDRNLKEIPAEFPIRNEAHHGQKNLKGTIAMARAPETIDSASNQFFFNLADNPNLDHKDDTPAGYGYCAFGKVTSGDDVLEKINGTSVRDEGEFVQFPAELIVIESAQRVR